MSHLPPQLAQNISSWSLSWSLHPARCSPAWEIPRPDTFGRWCSWVGGWCSFLITTLSSFHLAIYWALMLSQAWGSWQNLEAAILYLILQRIKRRLRELQWFARVTGPGKGDSRVPTQVAHNYSTLPPLLENEEWVLYCGGPYYPLWRRHSVCSWWFDGPICNYLSKNYSVLYGCDYLDNDKDISWYILMGLKKRDCNLFFLGWTPCESIKQFTFTLTLTVPCCCKYC